MLAPNCCRGIARPLSGLALLFVPLIVGCGEGSDAPKVVPVSGQVLLSGKPYGGAGVSFRPDAAKGNKSQFIPSGTANEEGEYELVTGDQKGAPVGWYKVVVFAPSPKPTGGEMPQSGPPPYNAKFTDPGATPLSVEVKDEKEPEPIDLELTP